MLRVGSIVIRVDDLQSDGIVLKPGETKELTHTFPSAGVSSR